MGWLDKNRLERVAAWVKGEPPIELTYIPSIPNMGILEPSIPGISESIEPDECYIELYLESLRLARARRFATRFHGVVYSFVSLAREGDKKAQLAGVSKPNKLTELDEDSLDRVITVSKQMMGPTAFRGGSVSLEFGLFSVKSSNFLTPILDYVTKVSSTAGISFVGVIQPFIPLITEGMDLIAGQLEDTELEVGVDTDITLTDSFVAAIVALPKESFDRTKLSLDQDRRLLLDGKPLNCGYAVFSLRRSTEKSDYGEIPELNKLYGEFQSAIKKNKFVDAKDALIAFRLATIASPDLIPKDATNLYKKAKQKFDAAFPPEGSASMSSSFVEEETLAEIGLYD